MTDQAIGAPPPGAGVAATLETRSEGETFVIAPAGAWRGTAIGPLHARIAKLQLPGSGRARLDLSRLQTVDSAGAWLVHGLWRQLDARGVDVAVDGAEADVAAMLDRVAQIEQPSADEMVRRRPPQWLMVLEQMGEGTIRAIATFGGLLSFLGAVTIALGRTLMRPSRIRLTAFLFHVEQTGLNALGIVGLINVLVGLVLAYMGAT